MSKMSQLHAELTEQAAALGFESIEDAEAKGYGIDYESGMLVDGRELAHRDYIKRKEEVLKDLSELVNELLERRADEEVSVIERAIEFIEEGEV